MAKKAVKKKPVQRSMAVGAEKKKEVKVCKPVKSGCGCGGAFYGIGFIGALVYYVMNSTGFWNIVMGVLKALVWPAFLVYEAMKFLGM